MHASHNSGQTGTNADLIFFFLFDCENNRGGGSWNIILQNSDALFLNQVLSLTCDDVRSTIQSRVIHTMMVYQFL